VSGIVESENIQKQWPKRELLIPEHINVVNTPLINHKNVYLPPLHFKFGLIKNYVKAMDQNIVAVSQDK
jgi:hypothetical protein